MNYKSLINSIMQDVNSSSTEPFIVYRDNVGEWHCDYTRNQDGEPFDWIEDIREQDLLSLRLTGNDFPDKSFQGVYDNVLRCRVSEEYYVDRSSGRDSDKLAALTSFFTDSIGAFSRTTTDYLATLERPLAALTKMCPYNLATGRENWTFNKDLASDALYYIEAAVQDCLRADGYKEKPEKNYIEGYEEKFRIQLAGKYIILAEDQLKTEPYLVCSAKHDNPFGLVEYYDGIVSDDYIEAMRDFLKRADSLVETLEAERSETGLQVQKLTVADCIQTGKDMDWEGRLLIVKPESLAPEYRSAQHQLAVCMGGFGSKPNARGNAVYVKELHSGKEMRYERFQIAGIADYDKLPDWAVKKLALAGAIKEPGVFEYGGYHFKPYRQFQKGEVKRRLEGDTRTWKTDAAFAMRNMSSDHGIGLSKYDWKKADYSHEGFYAASGNCGADIFKCIENGKLYVPHENELFQYKEAPQKEKSVTKKPSLLDRIDNGKHKSAAQSAERKDKPIVKKGKGEAEVT